MSLRHPVHVCRMKISTFLVTHFKTVCNFLAIHFTSVESLFCTCLHSSQYIFSLITTHICTRCNSCYILQKCRKSFVLVAIPATYFKSKESLLCTYLHSLQFYLHSLQFSLHTSHLKVFSVLILTYSYVCVALACVCIMSMWVLT